MDYSNPLNTAQASPPMAASPTASAPVEPKTVRFQLITPDSPHTTARLPMRVQIYPHDATDSIVTTVKNFYGLYSSPTSSKGVSFEDEAGNTMIARYENFRSNMVVYVRVIEEPALSPSAFASRNYRSPPAVNGNGAQPCTNGDANGHSVPGSYFPNQSASSLQHFHHLQEQNGEHISRPGSRTSRRRSPSPGSARGRRSVSASTNSKNRSRSAKNRNGAGGSQQSEAYGPDSMGGYSSGDGAPGSNNGRAKEQSFGNTEISVENIVEGGRRKRAKFESSELPLFAPPQMPAATSNPSVSPARRSDHRPSLPYVAPGQSLFSRAGALQSPQHYNTFAHYGQGGVYATPGSDGRHTRYSGNGLGLGMGVLPTPDPTVSSLSEEDKDVAMQLMRLGEISNMSYGRTSTSTQEDTFSGRADASSSTGATSDSESESGGDDGDEYEDGEDEDMPPHRKQRLDLNGASRKIYQSVETADELPAPGLMAAPPRIKKPTKANSSGAKQSRAQPSGVPKANSKAGKSKANGLPYSASTAQSNGANKTKKAIHAPVGGVPMSPASLPPSRKLSVSSTGAVSAAAAAAAAAAVAGIAEEDIADLSSKPRCQRCRKSKKGCDRQRPCGRCRDAGIPAELCVSEDEGNGRKGRYGRHMGVPIKKEAGAAGGPAVAVTSMQPPPPPSHAYGQHMAHVHGPSAIPPPPPPPAGYAPPPMAMAAPPTQSQVLPPTQQAPKPTMPALLPPAHISSTPIIAPTIPAMMMASADKSKKRKR